MAGVKQTSSRQVVDIPHCAVGAHRVWNSFPLPSKVVTTRYTSLYYSELEGFGNVVGGGLRLIAALRIVLVWEAMGRTERSSRMQSWRGFMSDSTSSHHVQPPRHSGAISYILLHFPQ